MQITNSFDMENAEVAKLLNDLATSLKLTNTLNFATKGSAVNLTVGTNFNVTLSFTDNSFALELNWMDEKTDEEGEDWRSQFDEDMAKAGLSLSQSKKVDAPPVAVKQEVKVDVNTPPTPAARMALQMEMAASTLSMEPGSWTSSFGIKSEQSTWSEIEIDGDLENTKWTSDDEIIAAPTIDSTTTKRRESPTDLDDDLFSSLDDLKGSKRKQGGKLRSSEPAKKVEPPSKLESTSKKEQLEVSEWNEPKAEDNVSDDDWVKPSEFLKNKTTKKSSIPAPAPKATKSPRSKKATIPEPSDAVNNIISDVKGWKEPEEEASDEKLVRPSEVIKAKSKGIPSPDGSDDPRYKKPPTAPDKKKDDKKKGWAEW